MTTEHDYEFALERRLKQLDPILHRRYTNTIFALQNILWGYKKIFPEYTDHSELHSLSVIHLCNQLIGSQITHLNADEIYVLLTATYLHDTGMGLSRRDYEDFTRQLAAEGYPVREEDLSADTIREYHHEFSGLFIRKYASFFDIPSPAHLEAIVQVAKGHRKTNLLDEEAYPIQMKIPGGSTLCMPYLAALIRLADEIDICSDRNPQLLYDIASLKDPVQILENRKVEAVKKLLISEKAFTIVADDSDPAIWKELEGVAKKMQLTLDMCRAAVLGRTPYVITQVLVELRRDQ